MARRGRQDADREAMLAILPQELRDQGEAGIAKHVENKLEEFEIAVSYSDTPTDAVRQFFARECIRLAVDPRIGSGDVRSRSGALLNAAKALGLDRNTPRFDVSATTVETALKRLREAIEEGRSATEESGRLISGRTGKSLNEVLDGQEVLLRGTPPRSERTGENS
jgi:hypothetical protein